jgi:hypothetical protein
VLQEEQGAGPIPQRPSRGTAAERACITAAAEAFTVLSRIQYGKTDRPWVGPDELDFGQFQDFRLRRVAESGRDSIWAELCGMCLDTPEPMN